MALIVQKYGGTSVGTVERIKNVARRVMKTQSEGNDVVVVVSAMSGETNRLVALAKEVDQSYCEEEYDVLVSSGEQVSIALLSMAIKALGGKAKSCLGHQVKILTDSCHGKARIKEVEAEKVKSELAQGKIVVIAGFQGVDEEGDITTLGRGGSDTSAVAVAIGLNADVCEIYTDVDGVYTTDPNICSQARKIDKLSFEEMLEMASMGAKVLQNRSVELAAKFKLPLHVRSSFNDRQGTWVTFEESQMEDILVSGISYNRDEAKLSVRGLTDQPNVASTLFSAISSANINVDMIVQNIGSDGKTDITFTVPKLELVKATDVIEGLKDKLPYQKLESNDKISKVSIIGLGMRSHAGVADKMFSALGRENINIEMISTSEIKVSVIIDQKYTELAVRVLHEAFGLAVS